MSRDLYLHIDLNGPAPASNAGFVAAVRAVVLRLDEDDAFAAAVWDMVIALPAVDLDRAGYALFEPVLCALDAYLAGVGVADGRTVRKTWAALAAYMHWPADPRLMPTKE